MDLKIQTRTQRNGVFRIVADAGLDPLDFEWVDVLSPYKSSNTVSALCYRSDPKFRFVFDQDPGTEHDLGAAYLPGEDGKQVTTWWSSWAGVLSELSTWCRWMFLETSEPDLWEAAKVSESLVRYVEEQEDNQPFSDDEVRAISERLQELEHAMVEQYDLTAEAQESIHRKLDLLRESSSRLGRKDWLLQAVGVLSNIAVAVLVAPEAAANIYWLFESGMRGLKVGLA